MPYSKAPSELVKDDLGEGWALGRSCSMYPGSRPEVLLLQQPVAKVARDEKLAGDVRT
jgi:hypothetical protein